MRKRDWSATPLGPTEQWPQSLRTVVQILLTSRYAMWMGWGPGLTFLYNDAYRPTLGIKHPWALGSRADQVWAEIWLDIGPRINSVLRTGEATYDEGLLLFLKRSGFPEETYHTFSYSPLHDDCGKVSGMLCVVTEETERVISERRMATLRDLAAGLAAADTEAEVLSTVRGSSARIPGTHRSPSLTCSTLKAGQYYPRTPALTTAIQRLVRYWRAVLTRRGLPVVCPRASRPRSSPSGNRAMKRPAGFLVVGVNPYRRYDEAYGGFVELVSGQIAAGIANARAYEQERQRAEALTELDRAKTAFFSNVSHEFRTPLTLMLGPIEDILAWPEGQVFRENRELLKVVHRNRLRLQRLVNALLDFSRLEAGRTQASFEPIDLAAFTAALASNFRSAMERAGRLPTSIRAGLCGPGDVGENCPEPALERVQVYARRFRPGATRRARWQNGPPHRRHRTGHPGSRAPTAVRALSPRRGYTGSHARGNGHWACSGAGTRQTALWKRSVSSVVGQGSTFTVSVPFGSTHLPPARIGAGRTLSSTALHADAYLKEAVHWLPDGETAAEQPEQSAPQPVATGVRSRVLLADDNADMRDYVRRLLSTRYEVTVVANGEEALHSALA